MGRPGGIRIVAILLWVVLLDGEGVDCCSYCPKLCCKGPKCKWESHLQEGPKFPAYKHEDLGVQVKAWCGHTYVRNELSCKSQVWVPHMCNELCSLSQRIEPQFLHRGLSKSVLSLPFAGWTLNSLVTTFYKISFETNNSLRVKV